MSYFGPEADHSFSYPRRKQFSDEGGKAIKGNLVYFIRNDNTKAEAIRLLRGRQVRRPDASLDGETESVH